MLIINPLNTNYVSTCTFQGILEAYHYALQQVQLFGPTNFSYFLDKAIEYASESNTTQGQQNYTILLVITVSMYVHVSLESRPHFTSDSY